MSETEYRNIVLIGCSTGGPKALCSLLPKLAVGTKTCYIIVQHIMVGYSSRLAASLDRLSDLSVKEAEDGEKLKIDTVYIAPGGKHLEVLGDSVKYFHVLDADSLKGAKPSIDVLFNSIANSKTDKKVISIILTGMGNDGLGGVRELHNKVDNITIVEDESTCLVYGMPKAIVNNNLYDYKLPLHGIADKINELMEVVK